MGVGQKLRKRFQQNKSFSTTFRVPFVVPLSLSGLVTLTIKLFRREKTMKNLFLVAAIAMGAMFVGVNQADAGGCGYSNWNSGYNWNSGFNRSYSNFNHSPYRFQNNLHGNFRSYNRFNNFNNYSHMNRNLRFRQHNGFGYGY